MTEVLEVLDLGALLVQVDQVARFPGLGELGVLAECSNHGPDEEGSAHCRMTRASAPGMPVHERSAVRIGTPRRRAVARASRSASERAGRRVSGYNSAATRASASVTATNANVGRSSPSDGHARVVVCLEHRRDRIGPRFGVEQRD